jgi:hypothetical protein
MIGTLVEICRAEFLLDVLDVNLGTADKLKWKASWIPVVRFPSPTPPIYSRCRAVGNMASRKSF